ncbi:MAG: RpiB/LacA/LacB family sugar-phosphate isomerase, partial [Lachnospiraceae bacterium]
MKVSIGCDHGGYDLKEEIKKHLIERGIEVVDVGCDRKERCDYPIYG